MSQPDAQRGNRQRIRGVVVREKGAKTVTVEVVRRFRHPRYGKMVRRNKRLAAHDPTDQAHLGDTVEIVSCRPISKTKRYRLVRIVQQSPGEALVGQPPARLEPEPAKAGATKTPDTETPEAGQTPPDTVADAGPDQEADAAGEMPTDAPEPADPTDSTDPEPNA